MMKEKNDLTVHWMITVAMLVLLIIYVIACHAFSNEIQLHLPEQQRVLIRTAFYIIAIILFPITNLLRHILLRLNQTMPGNNPAKKRYFSTITITLAVISIVGIFGIVMFYLGDSYNTLYIFSVLAALGVFLHRPRQEEYQQIIQSLKEM